MGDDIFGESMIKIKPETTFGKHVGKAADNAAIKAGMRLASEVLNDINNYAVQSFTRRKKNPYTVSGLPKNKLRKFIQFFRQELKKKSITIKGRSENALKLFETCMRVKISAEGLLFEQKMEERIAAKGKAVPKRLDKLNPVQAMRFALLQAGKEAGVELNQKEINDFLDVYEAHLTAKADKEFQIRKIGKPPFSMTLSDSVAKKFTKSLNTTLRQWRKATKRGKDFDIKLAKATKFPKKSTVSIVLV